MSTFDGKVVEFPDIRIDSFRPSPTSPPALAYFLSHVHSDHLDGLESCKSPFIYCSPGTRDILLRLEKYPHRMNFAKGILETRKQTYRHLKNLLKAIPLETATRIELAPGREIQVTLFDANHCVGAVMFLIEGAGRAVLYTGDIRSEPWWVNSLTKSPMLLPYAVPSDGSEPMRRLDNVYLDTTFVTTGRDDLLTGFPPKSDGVRELLRKVAEYPDDTLFYFDAWTFGYEDVWIALSSFLKSGIHVDDYRHGLYRALSNGMDPKAPEATKLMGFYCGNHFQDGCLSAHSSQCRIHSCEKGTGCDIWNKDFVRITPIISRHNGTTIAEIGAGGGQGDLSLQHELEVGDTQIVAQLMALCASKLSGQPQLLAGVLQMLTSIIKDGTQAIKLDEMSLMTEVNDLTDQDGDPTETNNILVEKLVPALTKIVTKMKMNEVEKGVSTERRASLHAAKRADGLPKQITFPYSRHSSYRELCDLIAAFRPKNIYPCTVDEARWTPGASMNALFGHIYGAPQSFRRDVMMFNKKKPTVLDDLVRNRDSPESDCATPKSRSSLTHINNVLKAQASTKAMNPGQGSADSCRRDSGSDSSLSRDRQDERTGHIMRSQRRVTTDHYSPPRRMKRKKSTTPDLEAAPSAERREIFPRLTETPSTKTIGKHIVAFTARELPPKWQHSAADDGGVKGQYTRPQEYGRLSPPRNRQPHVGEQATSDGNFIIRPLADGLPRDVRSKAKESPRSSAFSSPAAENRLAFRQEVHDAILGYGDCRWDDIGLISTSSYQRKEEEL